MPGLGASIILLLLLLLPLPANAEVWRCPQAGGPDLFTDNLKDPSTCQIYEKAPNINVVPSSSTTTLPDVIPYQPMPVSEPPAPPETRREVTEPYTPTADEEEPYDYLYSYPNDYWIPFIPLTPRHHHHHHGLSSSHRSAAHSSGHGGGHGGHR
jgi:hypothetical protein